jgi:phenylacetate-CoA ligase
LINAGDSVISNIYKRNKIYRISTSGSSGVSLNLYQSQKDSIYAAVSYDRARYFNGFNQLFNSIVMIGAFKKEANHKLAFIDQINLLLRFKKRFLFIDLGDGQSTVESLIQNMKFDAIKGYPSFMYLLANHVQMGRITIPKLQYIFTASECIDNKTRSYINEIFGVNPIDLYGAWEAGCIGWECKQHKGYHTNIDMLALQVSDNKNDSNEYGKGNLIITNLNNKAFPFIRYQLNDIVELSQERCSCGNEFPLIKSILGRKDDFIILKNGTHVSPSGLLGVMHNYGNNILEFQIIQVYYHLIKVFIVIRNRCFAKETIENLKKGLINLFNDNSLSIHIEVVEHIQKTAAGKHKSIISKVI